MIFRFRTLLLSAAIGITACAADAHPWDDKGLAPDERAKLVLGAMSQDEKLTLVYGYFGSLTTSWNPNYRPPKGAIMGSAGYVPGISRLGIPALWETDAGLGVATQSDTSEPVRERTSLPSGLATAATWNPDLAFAGGAMIGAEARDSGFNVMLAGGANLVREPTGGRNFEYAGEDPWLAGVMAGATIRGIQSNNVISTIKHYALNAQENGRKAANAILPLDQARSSDLLAFQIAIEQSDPGSVMCSYNKFNGPYACENPVLLNQVLKKEWGYKGFVMSDWGGVHSAAPAANAGLDQESGEVFDDHPYFDGALKEAVSKGEVSRKRLDDMASRILRTMFAKGVIDHPVAVKPIDIAAHADVARKDAEESLVLLKNDSNLLPLAKDVAGIAVIGAHADVGVLAGGGSSLVYPVGGNAVPGLAPKRWPGPVMYHPSSPLAALKARLPGARIGYVDGEDVAAAAALAAKSAVALVFVQQWAGEEHDEPLALAGNQDALVAAVAAANPRTIVVVESGGPVLMPWLNAVSAVVEAWYPGTQGGEAITRVLLGEAEASGRLPVSFPQSPAQLPRPTLQGKAGDDRTPFDIHYDEGAAVGYKWYDSKGLQPLFAFGYGLSYTSFAYSGFEVRRDGDRVVASFTLRNTGNRPGADVPQLYAGPEKGGWEAPRRLAGWQKLSLAPGEAKTVSLTVDPRLLSTFNPESGKWEIAPGSYEFSLGASSRDLKERAKLALPAAALSAALASR